MHCKMSMKHHKIVIQEKIEDTKGIKRNHKSKQDRQLNDQKKKDRQLNDQKKQDRQHNDEKKQDRQHNDQKKKNKRTNIDLLNTTQKTKL